MAALDRNDKKHLLNPAKSGNKAGQWMPEMDPIFACNSFFGVATNVAVVLGTVATSRVLFCYGLVISNISTTACSFSLLEGATIKLEKRIIGGDEIEIGYGNPRAPICRFNALEPIRIQSTSPGISAATVKVTLSWWDAELT